MKKLILLAMILLIAALGLADVYPIGTLGTSSSSTYGPVNGYFDFGWTKTIVTAAEMTAAGYDGSDNITGLGYYVGNTPSNYQIIDVQCFIRHTALSTYTSTADETGTAMPDASPFTQVFAGTLNFNGGGWHYFTFNQASFDWDGTSNIEIFWKNYDGDYVTGYPTYRYASTSPDYRVVYKQQDTTWPTTAGTRSTSRSNISIVTPQTDPPNPAILGYPTDAGYAFLDATLSWSDGGGMPDGYDVYLDTVDGSTLVSNDQPGTSYTPTLAPGTTYYWKVVPYNANGPATGVTTWSFKTPTADQIAESFDATEFPPLGWTTPGGAFTRSTTTPYYGAACAYEYIAAGPSYLYTPMLQLTATSELDWWMRTSATTGIGRVQIVYSEDGTTWNNIGDEIVMPTETTWMNYNVDLSSLAGNNYMIGFKVYSSTSTSTYFYIDHVVGPELAALVPEPAMLVYPADAGYAFLDASLSWNAAGSGGIPTSYDVYFGTTNPPDYVTNQAELTYTPTLAAATTYYWQIVPRNGTGPAENCPVWSFTTPTATQLAESFDATTFPPLGWLRMTSSTSYWGRSTTSPFYGAASMYASTSTSTPYTISTPVLAIDATSGLDFYAKASATTQVLQVLQSTDRTTWTQVGADITFAATGIWYPVSIDLSGLTPGNYYLAFHSPTQTAASYIYVDHLIGPELAAVAPGPVTLSAPADAAIDQTQFPTFTWTAPTLGGLPTGYKVYCDMNTDPTTEIGDVTGLSFTATTALTYSNVYYWKVVAYNASGNSTGNTVRSFTVMADPTIYTMPWLEDFGTTGTTFPPLNWTRWSGALANPSTLTSGSTIWGQDNWLNDTTVTPVNWSARMNIYSTARYHWIITPPIQMPGAGYQLEFDLGLTDYASTLPPDDPAGYSGVDDKFVVLISDGSSWTTANAVKIWDNDAATTGGIYEVYNDVPHTGSHWILPLDSYTGIKYIAFYGESTVSNADNDFFVDNVMIRQTPAGAPEHVTLASPADEATGVIPENTVLSWTPALTGGTPEYYEIYVSSTPIDPENSDFGEYFYESENPSLNLSAQGDIELGYSNTWYWAVLPFNSEGASPDPTDPEFMIWSFTTIADPTITSLPKEEYFDSVTAPALPYGWSAYINSTSTSAVVATYNSTTYAQSAPNSVRLYNPSDESADLRLITPMIDLGRSLNTIKMKFYARSSSAGYPLLVGSVSATDGTGVFTQLQSIALTTTKTEYTVSFADYVGTDQYICFKHGLGGAGRSLYVDNVRLIELLPADLAATTITGPGLVQGGEANEYVITVFNEGTATQNSYTVNLMQQDTRLLLATLNVTTPLDPGASAQHIISWTPSLGGTYQIYGQVVATGDGNTANDNTPLKEVNILDATMTVIPVGDDATTTSGYYVPLFFFDKNGVTEELYFADEMHLASGNINSIVYKNNFNATVTKQVKIWMAHTTATDLSGGWLPAGDYTLVFDGSIDFPAGVNYVVIPLDTPFNYTGGNLATRVHNPMDTSYSTSKNWYYTNTPEHTNRSRYLGSDSVTYDPLAPSAAGTAVSYVPNTMFIVQNAVLQTGAILQGHVYEADGTTPVEGATVALSDERYSTTTNAEGFYEFTFWENHTVTAVVSKATYYSQTVTGLNLTMGNTVTQNFNLNPMPRVTVSGLVNTNDIPGGTEGAAISLTGSESYNATSVVGGTFSIPNVLGSVDGLAYTIVVAKTGYPSYTSSVTVYATNLNLGTITLTENLWPAYNLVASHSGENAQLVWDPAAEPDYMLFDFEADNGGWVGSGYGDWEYTDTYTLTGYTDNDTSVGTPPTAAHSGDGLWGTKVLGDYSNSSAWSYLRKTVDLAGFTSPVLSIWHYMNGYNTYDYGIIKVNGTTVWGSSAAAVFMPWQQLTVPLTAFEGMSTVEISFEWYATSGVSYAGWYLDDIYIGPASSVPALANRNGDRSLQNYSVYRMLAADEAIPANWILLNNAVTENTYTDTAFGAQAGGKYKWAVKANYSGGLQSEAIISNRLGIVAMPQDVIASPVGATVQLSWTADAGADYYVIYAADDPYGAFTLLGYSATNSYTINSPAARKFYKIAAADGTMPNPAPPAKAQR